MRQVSSSTIALVIGTLGILADINVKTNTNQEAIEGANTTLVCTFTPQDGIDISWSIDDGSTVLGKQLVSRNVVLDDRYSIVNQASLLINTVRQIDAGTYICSIYSSIDKRLYSSSVQLDVFWLHKPRIILPEKPIIEGENTTVVCSTVSYPDVIMYAWYRQGYEIPANHPRYVQSSKTGILDIYHAGYEDYTSFTCTASNSVESKTSDEVILNVQYSPRFTLRKQGNTIRCFPYGNPMIKQVVYFINGTQQPNVQQVVIDERFCNTFTCFAENLAGKGNRTEIYCPKVKISPEKPDDLGNQTLVGVLTSVLIFLLLSVVMIIVYAALRPGPDFEQEHGRYEDLFIDGPSSV